MYSKTEISKYKEEFWTTFGKYLSPVPSAEGMEINWINYKTGVKDVKFFMEADHSKAVIGIKLTHPDKEIQQIYFEEFLKLKSTLENYTGEEWEWVLHTFDAYGKNFSLVFKELHLVNLFKKEDWPDIITFLKPRIIALDAFWCDWKYSIEALL